jgi:hypothetical protein
MVMCCTSAILVSYREPKGVPVFHRMTTISSWYVTEKVFRLRHVQIDYESRTLEYASSVCFNSGAVLAFDWSQDSTRLVVMCEKGTVHDTGERLFICNLSEEDGIVTCTTNPFCGGGCARIASLVWGPGGRTLVSCDLDQNVVRQPPSVWRRKLRSATILIAS